ncbi:MAG: hypothetical protein QOI38_2002 [Sphingomonadales bacterium]|jgi:hypothetical protein|nr:hypothetical protein [Sphingomonadales bacterium]
MRYAGLAAIAALAACGGDTGGNNAAADKAADAGRPLDLEPGSWRSEIGVLAIEQPGGPDPDGRFARQMAERLSARNRCWSPEAVQQADLHDTLSSGPWRGGSCVYSRRSVTTAGVDIAMDCEGLAPGHRLQTIVRGTAAPRATDLVIESRSRHPRTGAAWIERYRVRSTWVAPSCQPSG